MSLMILLCLASAATALCLVAVVLLAGYGLHSLWLLLRFLPHRHQIVPSPMVGPEPAVLVQLPVFNERDVVDRLVTALGNLDWPRHRLRLPLLDDSTDDALPWSTPSILRVSRERLERPGFAHSTGEVLADCDDADDLAAAVSAGFLTWPTPARIHL